MKIIVLMGAGLVLVWVIRGMRPSVWAIASLVLFAGLAVPAARANTIFVLSLGPNTTGSDEMTILSSPEPALPIKLLAPSDLVVKKT